MKLSVIILNYNVRYFLEQCIHSVQKATKGWDTELIIVDNASSDNSCEMVKELFPSIILIENTENIGFSKANNQGVAIARGEFICILNPDTAVAEETFHKCFMYANEHPKMGALGVKYQDGTGNFLPESKRNVPTPIRSLLKIIGYSKGKKGYYASHLDPESFGIVEVLAGAFMFMKKEVYQQVGGFDEDYFMYGEDIDLCYKIMKAGYENHYLGEVTLLHYKGESTQKDTMYLNRFYGAMDIFYRKHFKKSFFLTLLVSLGVGLVKFFKKIKIKSKNTIHTQQDEVFVITQDIKLLKKLSEKMELPVKSISKSKAEDENISNKIIVFDAQFLSFHAIFNLMKIQKNRNNFFRIYPSNRNFIIGSDQSDQKGEVTLL